MSSNNGAPQPPYNPDGVPQPRYDTGQGQYGQYRPGQQPEGQTEAFPTQPAPTQAFPTQQQSQPAGHGQPGFPPPGSGYPGQSGQPGFPPPGSGYPGQPGGPGQGPGDHNKKSLFLILGGVAVVVIIALVVAFTWLIPSMAKPTAVDTPAPSVTSSDEASDAAAEPSAEPSGDASASSDIPAGAIPLPAVWEELAGPTNVPADGDPLFSKWVTGESSFQYLAEWTHDESFGITKDPSTGEEIQKKAQGTTETDGDGIALAYAFFAESEEGKFGKDPVEVKKAIQDIEARYKGMTATELPQNLVGHKCTSDFKTSMPEIREFRRGAAVVIAFTCTNARGEAIEAVNLFSVTPWGTPQMLGVSGHKEYWDAHPGLFEQLGNSYRINKWKMS
ncbi:hypothetical protein J2Y66_001097 [Paenarthrobacter nitroguajacolicus]|uniref:hypothetical protein n=1 Tax=Paenarthrobacter nitroguajacolicus TaxID=211146 RepID=UPI00285CA17B|nr:hypothetical protein [Paenarthrobacter nitroguajacolicus]MDR6986627.1 hypothetical protein [Paenarthrobacter nitroguajacolicus]